MSYSDKVCLWSDDMGSIKKYEWKKIMFCFSEESRSSGVTFDVLLKCSQHFKLSRGRRHASLYTQVTNPCLVVQKSTSEADIQRSGKMLVKRWLIKARWCVRMLRWRGEGGGVFPYRGIVFLCLECFVFILILEFSRIWRFEGKLSLTFDVVFKCQQHFNLFDKT